MKKGKQEKKVDLRNFTQPKDIIPDKLVSTLRVREPKPPKTVEPGQPDHGLANRYIQDPVFEEWPSDETIAAHDFGVTTDKVFNDPHQIPLPPSMKKTKNVLVSFKRYKEYLASLIDKNTVAVSKRGLMKQNTLTDFGDNTSFQRKTSSPRIKSRAVSMEFEADRIDLADFQYTGDDKIDVKVCDYFERPETAEEAEERKRKEEANTKGKKKPAADKKKGHIEEEHIHMVKEPLMGFISMIGKKPDFSRWIGSILQVIKDRNIRDCYTGRSILKNIYPQVDGVPVYNTSGKYWIKLYFLGKSRKIEIDDVFPFDGFSFRFLYPMAEYANMLWPLILTKALYKLFAFKWKYNNIKDEIGEGAVLYSLTGLLPCTFNLGNMNKDWSLLEEALNSFNYSNGRAYVIGYCSQNASTEIPSNHVDRKSAFKIMARQTVHSISPVHHNRAKIDEEFTKMAEDQMEADPHYVESNIQTGYAYSIFDCFSNNRFNMVYVEKIPDWEIKMRREYLEALKEPTNRKLKEQILEIKRKRKDLRTRIKEEDKKRIDLINKEPVNYRIFKIMSNSVDQKQLAVICPFNEEEIYTAKKCSANRISRPPNYYDFYDEKKDDKSALSTAGAPAGGNLSNQQAIIENSIASALKPLTNFSKLPNHKEPEDRGKLGTWILDSDLASCFEYVQIYYNPSVYPHVKSDYYRSEQEKVSTFKPESEIVVVEEIKQEDDAEDADGHGTLQGGQQTPVQSINQPVTGGNTNQGAGVLVHTGSSPHVVFD